MSTPVSTSDAITTHRPATPASGTWLRFRAMLGRSRTWIHARPRLRAPYRLLVALAGLTVMAVGLILVPLPGPGWLIVFVGVAVLGTEFPAAHRVTTVVRRLAHRLRLWWQARQQRQNTRAYS
ncbi:TIGR02611 family protein [Cryobacterium zongtaii]|nr:TIGR02611 family protein [Cryobacterium zongtaii]